MIISKQIKLSKKRPITLPLFTFILLFISYLSTQGEKPDSAVRRYVRQDIKRATVYLDIPEGVGRESFACDVRQLELWAFDTHVVILVLEISVQDDQGMSIAEVEAFQDQVRRVYPPYWMGNGRAGHCPKK